MFLQAIHLRLQLALTDVLAIITAIGVLLTGIGTYMNRYTNKQIHQAVKTKNGHTLAEIVEDTNEKVSTKD